MQALISLPRIDDGKIPENWEKLLLRKVCGVPLLLRVLATASRAGVTSILIVHPETLPEDWLKNRLQSRLLSSIAIETLPVVQSFDPNDSSHWRLIENRLEPKFLWLPWNFVTVKRSLSSVIAAGQNGGMGVFCSSSETSLAGPAVLMKEALTTTGQGSLDRYLTDPSLQRVSSSRPSGIAVESSATAREAERLLVRGSGKATDGIYSNFNRWLCRPAVRWLSKTPVTANMVTFAGLPLGALSGYFYAQGYWSAYVAGGLLFFVSVLVDEMDGMLARTKFQDSPFGCWLESFVDYVTYMFLFSGMVIGLYRQYGEVWLVLGGVMLFGLMVTFFVAARLRKVSTRPDQPQEHVRHLYERLEADSGNFVSRFIRKLHFLTKKGALCHFILLFSVLGALPGVLVIAAFGANLTWILALYSHRLFRAPVPGEIPG